MTFDEWLDAIEEGFYAVAFILMLPLFAVWCCVGFCILILTETIRS